MHLHRPARQRWLWLIATAFLWMQLATAAYACPMLASEAPMAHCEGMGGAAMDKEQPTLCKAHCDKEKQSVGAELTPVIPLIAVLAHGLGWRVADSISPVSQPARTPDAGPPRGAPPLYIAYLVLRN